MIKSFKCKHTQELVETGPLRRFTSIQRAAERKQQQLVSAEAIKDLKSPPGNRLEQLSGDREGQYSIRINDQWRVCFRWADEEAEDVEVVDYQ